MKPKKLLKRIRECESKIDNLKTLPYYSIFKQEGQRLKDIAKAERKLEKLRGKLIRGFDSFVDSELHLNAHCSFKPACRQKAGGSRQRSA